MADFEAGSQRPYLLRAMHEWMTDNGETPHVVVDVNAAGVQVPLEYARDDKIILNISYAATSNIDLSNELISFDGRFSGVRRRVQIPVDAVLGIFAKDSGQGMIFSEESAGRDRASPVMIERATGDSAAPPEENSQLEKAPAEKPASGKSHLRIVK